MITHKGHWPGEVSVINLSPVEGDSTCHYSDFLPTKAFNFHMYMYMLLIIMACSSLAWMCKRKVLLV